MNSENRVRVLKIVSSRPTAPANIIFTQELEYIVNTQNSKFHDPRTYTGVPKEVFNC